MYAASAALISTVRDKSFVPVPKIERLVSLIDPTVVADLTIADLSGSIAVSYSRDGRRRASLELKNATGEWTPTVPTDAFFEDTAYRISYGVTLPGGAIEYVPQGVFLVNWPNATGAPRARTLTVELLDLWKRIQRTRLPSHQAFAAGSPYSVIVTVLMAVAGIPPDRTHLDPALDAILLPPRPSEDLNLRRGTAVSDCLAALNQDRGLDFYFDSDGLFRAEPARDVENTAVDFALDETLGCYQAADGGFKDSPDFANHIGVSSRTDPTVFGEAKDNDPTSITYVGGPMGDRYRELERDGPLTQGQAMSAALNELRRAMNLARVFRVRTTPLPMLDVRDVVSFTSSDHKATALRTFVSSIAIPIAGGEQVTELNEVRTVTL